jgi:hypothetical protein
MGFKTEKADMVATSGREKFGVNCEAVRCHHTVG